MSGVYIAYTQLACTAQKGVCAHSSGGGAHKKGARVRARAGARDCSKKKGQKTALRGKGAKQQQKKKRRRSTSQKK